MQPTRRSGPLASRHTCSCWDTVPHSLRGLPDTTQKITGSAMLELTWSALIPLFGNALVVGIVASMIFCVASPTSSFGDIESLQGAGINWVVIFLIWFQLLGSIFAALEGIQAGFQENYLLSIRAFFGNCISVVAILACFAQWPKLWVFVICLHGPPLLTRLVNAFVLFARKPFLRPTTAAFVGHVSQTLIYEGAIYSAGISLGAYLSHQLPVLLLAKYAGAEATALYAATLSLVLQLFSGVSMIAMPYVPALANSLGTGDIQWAQRSIRQILLLIGGYGLLCLLALAFAGPQLCRVWFRGEIVPGQFLLATAGAYLLAIGIENFLFLVLCSGRNMIQASVLYLARAVVCVVVAIYAAQCGHRR